MKKNKKEGRKGCGPVRGGRIRVREERRRGTGEESCPKKKRQKGKSAKKQEGGRVENEWSKRKRMRAGEEMKRKEPEE